MSSPPSPSREDGGHGREDGEPAVECKHCGQRRHPSSFLSAKNGSPTVRCEPCRERDRKLTQKYRRQNADRLQTLCRAARVGPWRLPESSASCPGLIDTSRGPSPYARPPPVRILPRAPSFEFGAEMTLPDFPDFGQESFAQESFAQESSGPAAESSAQEPPAPPPAPAWTFDPNLVSSMLAGCAVGAPCPLGLRADAWDRLGAEIRSLAAARDSLPDLTAEERMDLDLLRLPSFDPSGPRRELHVFARALCDRAIVARVTGAGDALTAHLCMLDLLDRWTGRAAADPVSPTVQKPPPLAPCAV
eukprot:jgi/Mesvir1/18491/Mv14336-RA.1